MHAARLQPLTHMAIFIARGTFYEAGTFNTPGTLLTRAAYATRKD